MGCALLAATTLTPAADKPPYDPRSSSTAPCGTGTPPPGHDPPEIRADAKTIALSVRQDGNRLCYVVGDNADAPVIRVRLGSDFSVTLRNEITDPAAIDAVAGPGKLLTPTEAVPQTAGYYRVIPGMRHHATGATNLHLHGFPVPPVKPQDDVLTVCTDPAAGFTGCGQRTFTYHYHVPADMPEGLYWYHPHVHGEVQAQMLMGLSGAIVVEGPQEQARQAAGVGEKVLIVRQTEDQDAGKAATAAMTAAPPVTAEMPSAGPVTPATQIDTVHELLCNVNSGIDAISVNGTPVPLGDAPDSALAHLEIPASGSKFLRLVNAATDAFLDLTLVDEAGKTLPIEVVARDGVPLTDTAGTLLQPELSSEAQMVPPSGRLEFLVRAPKLGSKTYLVTNAVDTGCTGDRVPQRRLAVIEASTTATPAHAPSTHLQHIRANLFVAPLEQPIERRRVIALAEYPRPGSEDQVDFYIAERRPGAVLKPYMMGDAPAITVRAGTTEEWVIENWTNELHAFHIHQVHFRVLEIDGQPLEHPPLLDVVNVPYATATGYHSPEGPVRPGRVRIKVSFPPALAGDIPFHCHLADHEDNGMMAVLRVLPQHQRGDSSGASPRL